MRCPGASATAQLVGAGCYANNAPARRRFLFWNGRGLYSHARGLRYRPLMEYGGLGPLAVPGERVVMEKLPALGSGGLIAVDHEKVMSRCRLTAKGCIAHGDMPGIPTTGIYRGRAAGAHGDELDSRDVLVRQWPEYRVSPRRATGRRRA